LNDVSFETAPGQIIGIFGQTGAGKSTFLSLIPRLYDPQRGRILADGQDLRDLDLDAYRRQIGIVYQESFLFSNTVAATSLSGIRTRLCSKFRKPRGLLQRTNSSSPFPMATTPFWANPASICPAGNGSGLALARALLLKPPILILDDPTASVDPKTEHEIVSALRHAMTGRTTFVVANRLSLLRRADIILVLEKGRLLQSGTHEQLLKMPGPYQETALLQLMDLDEAKPATAEESAIPGPRQTRPVSPGEVATAQM